MRKIRILAVAPYPEMKEVFESVSAGRNDLALQVVVGNTMQGAELVGQMDLTPFDVIISRGGTAEMIRSRTNLPVIEVELTPYDIQNALTRIMAVAQRYAIVGFQGITNAAITFCEVLGVNVDVYTIRSKEECLSVIRRLKAEGVERILCDMEGIEAAEEVGMDADLIISCARSIERTLNKAVIYHSNTGTVRLFNEICESELEFQNEQIYAFCANGEMLLTRPISKDNQQIRKMLARMIPDALRYSTIRTQRSAGGGRYSIVGRVHYYHGEQMIVFHLRENQGALPVNITGITAYDSADSDIMNMCRFFKKNGGAVLDRAQKACESAMHVVVSGEAGCHADTVARFIGMYSVLSNEGCYLLDCAVINEKGWRRLYGDDGLLSFRTGTTLIFLGLERLSQHDTETLFSYLQNTNLIRQLRLIVLIEDNGTMNARTLIQRTVRELYAIHMPVPSLRERKEELGTIVETFGNYYREKHGGKAPKISAEGIRELAAYDWPGNLVQLERVMVQLMLDRNSDLISVKEVRAILASEREADSRIAEEEHRVPVRTASPRETLQEITYRTVLQVLEEEGGNRRKTAERLGISRTTLWRILERS